MARCMTSCRLMELHSMAAVILASRKLALQGRLTQRTCIMAAICAKPPAGSPTPAGCAAAASPLLKLLNSFEAG